jgi:hypothetical protein
MVRKSGSKVFLAVAVLLLLPGAASAQAAGDALGVFLKQNVSAWSAKWWQQVLGLPAGDHPLTQDGPVQCDAITPAEVQEQGVWFLGGTFGNLVSSFGNHEPVFRSCTIPAGTALFIPVINAECSTVEGVAAEDLAACAKSTLNHVSEMSATVDGVEVSRTIRRVQSPDFPITLPASNLLGVDPQQTVGAADGFWVYLPPLSRGTHVIEFGGVAPFPEFDFTFETLLRYTITVE